MISYKDKYTMLKAAKFLWYIYKTIRRQIKEEALEDKKEYTVKLTGIQILEIYQIASSLFHHTRQFKENLERFGGEEGA